MESFAVLSEVSHDFGGFSVSRLRVRPGPVGHAAVSELRIIANLDARWETSILGGNTYEHDRGEICVLPPNLQRQTNIREPGEGLLICVNERTIDRLAAEGGIVSPWGGFRLEKLNDPVVNRLVLILGNEFKSEGFQSAIFTESVVTTLLGYLVRIDHAARDGSLVPGGLTKSQLQRCQQHIDANIDGNITIEVLARIAGLSPYYFIRAFKRSTGMTPHRCVLEAKVRNAQAMLMNSRKSIGEISRSVGFLSAGHFDAAFKKIVEMTPTAYRKLSNDNPKRSLPPIAK
jgi:AraC family transcriptional regulator